MKTCVTKTLVFLRGKKGLIAAIVGMIISYLTAKGILGFYGEDHKIEMYWLYSNGWITRDFGDFVSETKLNWKRYTTDHKHVTTKVKTKFVTPDKFVNTWMSRGMKETWDGVEPVEQVLTRVKK